METSVLPGGALLGPEIKPMTAEEEAAARERVKATLARLGHRPTSVPMHYPGKFSGIERVAALLRAAPPAVRIAWVTGWDDICFYPDGYTDCDYDGDVTTHSPGWYGTSPKHVQGRFSCFRLFLFICDSNGGNKYFQETICDRNSH